MPEPTKRSPMAAWLPALAASILGAVSAVWPMAALPAAIGALLAIVVSGGRARLVAILCAGTCSAVGTVRFVAEVAAPNIVSSGRKAAEDKALSRLREVAWAEALAIESRLVDTDRDGRGESTSIAALIGDDRAPWAGPDLDAILKRGLYVKTEPPAPGPVPYRVEAYLVIAYPGRGDPSADRAETIWEAYAWPSGDAEGTRRSFYVDESDRICETSGVPLYSDIRIIPQPGAATRGSPTDDCGTGRDGSVWRPWKKKAPRPTPTNGSTQGATPDAVRQQVAP